MEQTRLHALESSSSLHPSSVGAPWAEIIPRSKWCGPCSRSVTPVARRRFSCSRTAAAKASHTSRPSGAPRHRRTPMSRLYPRITSGTRSSPTTFQVPAGHLSGLKGTAFQPGNPDRKAAASQSQPAPIRAMDCSTKGLPRVTRDFCRFGIGDREGEPSVHQPRPVSNRSVFSPKSAGPISQFGSAN